MGNQGKNIGWASAFEGSWGEKGTGVKSLWVTSQ